MTRNRAGYLVYGLLQILILCTWALSAHASSVGGVNRGQLNSTAQGLGADLIGNGLRQVATIADIEALDVARVKPRLVYLQERGGGVFALDQSDLSSEVSGDPQQGVYVAVGGGDGSAGAWVRQFSPQVLDVKWFGATGNGVTVTDDIGINAAFVYGLNHSMPVYISAGTYKTSNPIYTRVPFSGAAGFNTKIYPQGAFPAFDVYEVSNGQIKNIYVDFSDVGKASIDVNCIGFRLLNNAPTEAVQIQNTVFDNLYIYRAYLGISYQYNGTSTFGDLWNVSFNHILVNSPKGVGIYLDCASGTLNVSISHYIMEGSFGLDSYNWSSSQGLYLKNMTQVRLDNVSVARVQNSVYGMVANFQSIHGLTIDNFQMEGANINAAESPIYFATCDAVRINMLAVTPTFTATAPYIYLDANMKGVTVDHIDEIGGVTGSGFRQFIGCNSTNPDLVLRVNDQATKVDACQVPGTLTTAGAATNIYEVSDVSASTVTIGALYVVSGSSTLDNSKGFIDIVAIGKTMSGTTVAVAVSTNNINGYSYSRSYGVVTNYLQVTIPTDAVYVKAAAYAESGKMN